MIMFFVIHENFTSFEFGVVAITYIYFCVLVLASCLVSYLMYSFAGYLSVNFVPEMKRHVYIMKQKAYCMRSRKKELVLQLHLGLQHRMWQKHFSVN